MIGLLKEDNLLYKIGPDKHNKKDIKDILDQHDEIKFVSLAAVDLRGNSTDERIPVSIFYNDIENFLKNGVQTDGSSVELKNIATLNDAKVTILPDMDSEWLVDYNLLFRDENSGKLVGTLVIPSFLIHSGNKICSRSILKRAVSNMKKYLINTVNSSEELKEEMGIKGSNLKDIELTAATELEFWVKTPQERANEEALNTSQQLKEQYWKRAEGDIRTAMEYILLLMGKYGFNPEMAHKEAGGVPSKLKDTGEHSHVMEQLEVVWKFSDPLTNSDKLQFIKNIITDIFNYYGLEVTFSAKPIENVSGSGEHMHIGICGILENDEKINLFNHKNFKENYLSSIGISALAGILNNYEVVNPFITSTTDAFNRLKPGYEAPVCVVCSLGKSTNIPSRNRTVLLCLIKDFDCKTKTRFELRSPNPSTNIYLAFASVYQVMIDGMKFYLNKYSLDYILNDVSKTNTEKSAYFEDNRQYRSENNIFEDFTEEERDVLFSRPPATVYENMEIFIRNNNKKIQILNDNNVFTDEIIDSYCCSTIHYWAMELKGRIIENYRELIRDMKKLHFEEDASDLDKLNWSKISDLKRELMKDTIQKKSIFTETVDAVDNRNYKKVSDLQIELTEKINKLKGLYSSYKKNIL